MTGNIPSGHFDTWLYPKPNGSCFCGFYTDTQFNLDGYDFMDFECIAEGNATTYTIILGYDDSKHPNATMEQSFKVRPATV